MFKLGWGHCTKFYKVLKVEAGGTPHIQNEHIWSYVQIRVAGCVGSWFLATIMPLCCSILQVGTCKTPHMKMYSDVHNRVGIPHIKLCSDVHNRMGIPHMKMCSDVHNRVGHRT